MGQLCNQRPGNSRIKLQQYKYLLSDWLVMETTSLAKGIIRCGVKLTMVDLAVPGYFSKKMKQPMKILMLLRIFLFVEF